MSISEHSFSSTISSNSNNSNNILHTRIGNNKQKINKDWFDSNSDSKKSYNYKNVKRNKTPNVFITVNTYTLNDTANSNNSISTNEIKKYSKWSNIPYWSSTNDSTNSSSINEITQTCGSFII